MNASLPSPTPPFRLPERMPTAHKGTFGRVLLVGGSRGMSGAIALAAIAALRSGAGLVSAAVPDRCLETVASFDPCIMTIPIPDSSEGAFAETADDSVASLLTSADAIGIGPGMGRGSGPKRLVDRIGQLDQTRRVIDADGLNVLSEQPDWIERLHGPIVLTPHPGEWSRLSGVDPKNRALQCQASKRIAAAAGIVIVLKGAETYVTDGQQEYVNQTGNAGMATAGSGDALTGITSALLAQNCHDPFCTAALAVWIHGYAGDLAKDRLGPAGMTATDLLAELPAAVCAATESPS